MICVLNIFLQLYIIYFQFYGFCVSFQFSMPSIFRYSVFSISTFLFHAGHIIAPQAPGAPPLPPPEALPPGRPATLTLQLSHPLEQAPKQQEQDQRS